MKTEQPPTTCPHCGAEKVYASQFGTREWDCGTYSHKGKSPKQSDKCTIAQLRQRCAELEGQLKEEKERDIAFEDAEECELCKQYDKENDDLRAKLEAAEAKLKREADDWADNDTAIRNLARPILGAWVDGDKYGVPTMVDVVDRLRYKSTTLIQLLRESRKYPEYINSEISRNLVDRIEAALNGESEVKNG